MRIVSWNIENMARWLDPASSLDLRAQARALGDPDVLCLQEIRVRPEDTELIARMSAALPGYETSFSLSTDRRNVTYRGGRAYGVATYVRVTRGPVVSASPKWDREGRVVVTSLARPRLAVVNVYAVNGTAKRYVDPESGADAGDRHAHKRRFQARLFDLLSELGSIAPVVAIGDWNVSRSTLDVTPRLRTEEPHTTARRELEAHLVRTGFVDVFRARHPAERSYSWFGKTRGGRLDAARVDYALVSRDLAPRVTEAGIISEARLRPKSDHAPIAIEIDV